MNEYYFVRFASTRAYTPLLAKDSETEGPEVGLQEFRRDRCWETPQGLRMLLGAFRGLNPLERIVGKPFRTDGRRHAVGHKKGLGVLRQSDFEQANCRGRDEHR